jgi:hypothetical protein
MTTKMNFFDYDLVDTYYTKGLLNGDLWVFLSHGNELRKPVSVNADKVATTFLEKTIAGIRLYPQDYAFMIPIRFWQQGVIYTEYDDEVTITNTPYFVAVEPEIESGNYHVFKCIANNYTSQSLEKPNFNQNILSGIYEGGDGYVWKYMTSVPYLEYRKFSARGFMPIFRNRLVEDVAATGIYNIKVENRGSNFGYKLFSGEVESVDTTTNTVIISTIRRLSGSDGTLSSNQIDHLYDFQIENFYADRILRLNSSMTNNIIGSRSFRIVNSGVTTETSKKFVRLDSVVDIAAGDSFEISPEIVISGDGAGAQATPIFEDDRITSIRMLAYGNAYKNATAYVVPPRFGFSTDQADVAAVLRPIVSPVDGHGSNVIRELNSKAISVSTIVSSENTSKIPDTGTYSKIGLVKSPMFKSTEVFTRKNVELIQENATEIELNSVSGIVPGMVVTFGDTIPEKTVVTSVSLVNSSVFLSAEIQTSIPNNSDITFSSVVGTFDNRIKLTVSRNELPVGLEIGETVTQGNITAKIHEINFDTTDQSTAEIFLIEYVGNFADIITASLPITTRLGSIGINTVEYSPYEQKSGEVLYISDITPIIRESGRVEQLRVIIQF